ncbi:hypothetical protein ALP76_101641 [Pseudomonas savastanoi pv. glycinea]|uniref:Uncharacterized protein n=1 Tax=Pseudomonas savastanoi pv. glycinea TaxID=318 RepID=A0A3M3G055_PSESG|nr:hypothetical protein ALQ73_101588 [Pseudomonas savastanoi pv. glycinea]RMR87745.1 hypothetical protein ALP76_101641 [Pseudomonas savastanoi pv. glycinea]
MKGPWQRCMSPGEVQDGRDSFSVKTLSIRASQRSVSVAQLLVEVLIFKGD